MAKKLIETSKKGESVKDWVYQTIRLDIISFELKPGERMSESQLAKRYDVGIASIRAALPQLVQEGLLTNKLRLGHVVAPITMQELREINQMRELLEPAAAELACLKVDVARLEEIDEQSKRPVPDGDHRAELESLLANKEFHIAIAAATGNMRLKDTIANIHDLSIRFQYLMRNAESEAWKHSHEGILEAFRNRDAKRAREEVAKHVAEGRNYLMQAVLELPTVKGLNIGAVDA